MRGYAELDGRELSVDTYRALAREIGYRSGAAVRLALSLDDLVGEFKVLEAVMLAEDAAHYGAKALAARLQPGESDPRD